MSSSLSILSRKVGLLCVGRGHYDSQKEKDGLLSDTRKGCTYLTETELLDRQSTL